MTTETIGFIGLGNMGGPMAAHVAGSGRTLVCYDAADAAVRAPAGARVAASSAEVGECCEIVLTSLPDGPVVHAVLGEILSTPNRLTHTFVDTSTIGIEWARRNAAAAAEAAVDYVDSPVSGGAAGARAGTVAVMCAGRADTIRSLEPLLSTFGGRVFSVGPDAGQAQAMKVLNNFLSGTAMAATSEAIAFGIRQGLDMRTMLDVLNASSGQNTATRDKFPDRVLTESYDAGFRIEQLVKDLGLYEEAASGAGAARPVSPAVIELWRRATAQGDATDISEIYKIVRDS